MTLHSLVLTLMNTQRTLKLDQFQLVMCAEVQSLLMGHIHHTVPNGPRPCRNLYTYRILHGTAHLKPSESI